jgi:sterol desaturase/sphingolipid hydroxylase (fatty acid hydroxylase superfamily)
LRYLVVTPNYHHWHHTRDEEGLDRCYAAHFPLWDYVFGTAITWDKNKDWPNDYGVLGNYVPQDFLSQQLFPFLWSGKWDNADEPGWSEKR